VPLVGFECNVCGGKALQELTDYTPLPRVTGDCKPFPPGGRLAVCEICGAVQKPTDARWSEEAGFIYDHYEPHFQSSGIEQAVFDSATGQPRRRSSFILDRLLAFPGLDERGAVIDVGCGNGVLLSAFAEVRPGWRLFGHELNELQAEALLRMPGFERLYTGRLSDLPDGFDLVTMMHSLNCFADPLTALRELRTKLRQGGWIFVEVPNAEATPFDLIIAETVSHFTRHDMARLLERARLGATVIADNWVTKELSVVALPEKAAVSLPTAPSPAAVIERVAKQIAWLQAVVGGARQAAREARGDAFGLFGSSIAAAWLYGQLSKEVAFFVDEDPSREGASLFGRPIIKPEELPAKAVVYVPLIPKIARLVAERLTRSNARLELPPDIP
jgi:SAM-dependent methyltransferase